MAATHHEKGCTGVTVERKYYDWQGSQGQRTFVKRSLRPHEWQFSPYRGEYVMPKQGNERLPNEAAALQYVRENTDVPVSQLHCCFEDDKAVYLVTEFVEGVDMSDLPEEQKAVVKLEVKKHMETLHNLRSRRLVGPTGLIVPPWRAMNKRPSDSLRWVLKDSEEEEEEGYVFCHGDLGQQNVIVDPESLTIKAIIDWEYAGFWPEFFEGHYFERAGPSGAMKGEVDDTHELMQFLDDQMVPEPQKHLAAMLKKPDQI